MNIFEVGGSNLRSYCRALPDAFSKAEDSILYAELGGEYIDFFDGAGSLNYGHNNELIKQKLLSYMESDGIMHGLDMCTKAKKNFIAAFSEYILKNKDLNYKIHFCGSTGTNAVEAALKLARKVKRRTEIFAFMGAFYEMSLGSLLVTSNLESREGAGLPP